MEKSSSHYEKKNLPKSVLRVQMSWGEMKRQHEVQMVEMMERRRGLDGQDSYRAGNS